MLFTLLAIVLGYPIQLIRLTLFTSVAVHVCLKRTGTSESFIADLALVLLLAAR